MTSASKALSSGLYVALAVVCLGSGAGASGWLPPTSTTEQFGTFLECRHAIERFARQDRESVKPRVVNPDGSTHQIELFTKGIERIDSRRIRYESELWFHNGWFRQDIERTETSHSFEKVTRECAAGLLTTTRQGGYTLSTFDPPQRSDGRP